MYGKGAFTGQRLHPAGEKKTKLRTGCPGLGIRKGEKCPSRREKIFREKSKFIINI